MQLELLDRYSHLDSPVHRLDPAWKTVIAFVFVLVAVLTPDQYWPVFVIEAAVLLAVYKASSVPWTYLAKRLGVFLPMVLIMALGVPLSRGMREGWELMAAVLCGSVLSFTSLLILMVTTPVSRLLAALHRLRVPALPITIGSLMIRYVAVMLDELDRMKRARAARTFRSTRRHDWATLPNLVGLLFIRSVERSERVYQSMLARGWDGEIHTLDHGPDAAIPNASVEDGQGDLTGACQPHSTK